MQWLFYILTTMDGLVQNMQGLRFRTQFYLTLPIFLFTWVALLVALYHKSMDAVLSNKPFARLICLSSGPSININLQILLMGRN